jgi:hypothetical protein
VRPTPRHRRHRWTRAHAPLDRRSGQRDLVELNIAAAGGRKVGDLGAVDGAEIAEKLPEADIEALRRIRGAAPEMHRRRRRQGDFGQRSSVVAQEGELVERDRSSPL